MTDDSILKSACIIAAASMFDARMDDSDTDRDIQLSESVVDFAEALYVSATSHAWKNGDDADRS